MKKTIGPLGKHLILELYACSAKLLDDLEGTRQALLEAAKRSRAQVISESFRKFDPVGVTGVVVISESHITIHTWPEYRYAAVDIFTCGDTAPEVGAAYLVSAFRARFHTMNRLERGTFPERPRASVRSRVREKEKMPVLVPASAM